MMKNNLPLWIIGVSLTIILISIPIQEAYAHVTSVTVTNLANTDRVSADFTIDYTVVDDGINDAVSGSIVFTESGTAVDGADPHTFVMSVPGDTSTEAHSLTRTFLEANANAAVFTLVDGATYVIVVSVVNGGTFSDTITGIDYDTSAPTMDSAITTSITTIDVTFSEDLADASVTGGDFTLSDGLVVDSILEANGVVTITTTVAFGVNDTPTVTLAGDGVTDVIDVVTANTLAAGPIVVATDGIEGGTGGDDDIPPSFVTSFDENEYPISIGNTKFTFAELGINNPTTTVEIGKPIRVNLLMMPLQLLKTLVLFQNLCFTYEMTYTC